MTLGSGLGILGILLIFIAVTGLFSRLKATYLTGMNHRHATLFLKENKVAAVITYLTPTSPKLVRWVVGLWGWICISPTIAFFSADYQEVGFETLILILCLIPSVIVGIVFTITLFYSYIALTDLDVLLSGAWLWRKPVFVTRDAIVTVDYAVSLFFQVAIVHLADGRKLRVYLSGGDLALKETFPPSQI